VPVSAKSIPRPGTTCRARSECGAWSCERDDEQVCGARPHDECGSGNSDNVSCKAGFVCHKESDCAAAVCRPRCKADADCDGNYACKDGDCTRKKCASDRDCKEFCVEGACSSMLGSCVDPTLPPPP